MSSKSKETKLVKWERQKGRRKRTRRKEQNIDKKTIGKAKNKANKRVERLNSMERKS